MRTDSVSRVQIQSINTQWVDVGQLYNVGNRNWFEFTDQYWESFPRPILGQIFEENGRHWKPSARVSLPRWFGHLLPEGRLRAAVADAAETNLKNEYDLLVRLGPNDLPGAIRVFHEGIPNSVQTPHTEDADDGPYNSNPILKFSLAGAQLKFSVYGDEKGITVPTKGSAGNLIVKFPDERPGFDGVPEAELGSLVLAGRSGIETPHSFLVDPLEIEGLKEWAKLSGGRKALAVTRFDRAGKNQRIHMEELAQILDIPTANSDAKYRGAKSDTVATVIAGLTDISTTAAVIDRIVLNIIIGNGDAHLKNWAILYKDGKTPTLSPAYDIVPTFLYIKNDNLGLKLHNTRSFYEVSPETFESIGRRTGYGVTAAKKRARETTERILGEIRIMSEYLTKENYDRLKVHVSDLKLQR
ncbi:type II toxin-antitoxin system HipA family toxin [Amycolatopsis pittospori]|uniref:type II toxin-antitoxin system HipA family toxin n=1 Tax=Amycolatopsis pittospori TaxID=2749434 RepID=UPI0015F09B04|nr:type II toxin-antitoxin system HipA family toxin [Amycolatopsis pittospori]